MSVLPYILTAFANTIETKHHLNALNEELQGVRNALLDNPDCQHLELSEAHLTTLEKTFKKNRSDIMVFHFAGHAGGQRVELVNAEGKLTPAFVQGLAGYLKQYAQPHLVFLNACATKDQARLFHNGGVKVVIATHRPINDTVAKDFAVAFYQNLASGASIQGAYDDAIQQLRSRHQVSDYYRDGSRDLTWMANEGLTPAEPYLLSLSQADPDAAQVTLRSLAEEFASHNGGDPSAEPVGEYSYLLCDRTKERNEFYTPLDQKFRQTPLHPQAFLLNGPSEELLRSLNDRFQRFTIQYLFDNPPAKAEIKDWTIELPSKDDFLHPDTNMPNLRRSQFLSHAFRLKGQEISAELVLKRLGSNIKIAFLQHYIMGEDWHPSLPGFLARYIEDFTRLELKTNAPFVILLFNFVYPAAGSFFDRLRRNDGKITSALQTIAQGNEHCALIQKLQPVLRQDTLRWQMEHLPQDHTLIPRIYGKKKKEQPMEVVEPELIDAIQRHNQRFA